jgi:heme-degrading monooxygenase HmoA
VNSAAADSEVYVMASRFEVRTRLGSLRFFLNSLRAWRQVQRAPGVFGAALVAHPIQRTFFTLSAWKDRDALYAFARTDPHGTIKRDMSQFMKDSTFTFWSAPASGLPIDWAEARRRIDEEAAGQAAGSAG